MPFPPSVNHYWKTNRRTGHVYLTKRARDYKKDVFFSVKRLSGHGFGDNRIKVCLFVYPPDKRRRDLDNICKAVLDSLQEAGVYNNDFQIDVLHVERMGHIKLGEVLVSIDKAPV